MSHLDKYLPRRGPRRLLKTAGVPAKCGGDRSREQAQAIVESCVPDNRGQRASP